MPVYTYKCENCGHEFDRTQDFSDKPLKQCPNCKKRTLQKVYKPAPVVFRGSGFYSTDHRSSSSASRTAAGNGSDSKSTDANGTGEAKPEKKETKPKKAEKSSSE